MWMHFINKVARARARPEWGFASNPLRHWQRMQMVKREAILTRLTVRVHETVTYDDRGVHGNDI